MSEEKTKKRTTRKKAGASRGKPEAFKPLGVSGNLQPAQIVPGWYKVLQSLNGSTPATFREVGRLNVVAYTNGAATETWYLHSETIASVNKYMYEPTGGTYRTTDHIRYEKLGATQGGAPTGIHYKIIVANCNPPIPI